MQSFGERLKNEREKQGVTLDEVCVSTKIAVRFLEAIEAEKFEKLPGGIFNKGFVRAYAQHLGINEDDAVADYLKAAGLLPTVPLNTTPPGEEEAKIPERRVPETKAPEVRAPEVKAAPVKVPETRMPEAKPIEVKKAAARVLPVETKAALVEAKPSKQKTKAARAQAKQEKKKQTAPVHPPEPQPEVSDQHWFPWGKVAFALLLVAFAFAMWGSFHREVEEHTSQPAEQQPAVNQSVKPPPQALQNVGAESTAMVPAATAPAETTPTSTVPEAQPEAIPAQESASVTDGAFLVVVEAREDSWVSIMADGKEVMKDVLGAPARRAIEARKEVVIKAGNIGALDFVFNGKKLPSQGDYDEVKTLTFDPKGLQSQPVKTAGL